MCICVCVQAKYECTQRHGSVKVVSPDWIVDSVEAGVRLEEERYHPSRLRTIAEVDHVSAEACNGTSEAAAAAPPRHPGGDLSVRQGRGDNIPPRVEGTGTVQGPPADVPPSAEEGVKRAPSRLGERVGEKGDEEEARGVPMAIPPKAEQLLDRVVICFTDYQDCVEDDTMEKWKLVSVSKDVCRVVKYLPSLPPLPPSQVVMQHGGEVLDQYDSKKCTHLLALHKKSIFFAKVCDNLIVSPVISCTCHISGFGGREVYSQCSLAE